jgi:hypothetical protein
MHSIEFDSVLIAIQSYQQIASVSVQPSLRSPSGSSLYLHFSPQGVAEAQHLAQKLARRHVRAAIRQQPAGAVIVSLPLAAKVRQPFCAGLLHIGRLRYLLLSGALA